MSTPQEKIFEGESNDIRRTPISVNNGGGSATYSKSPNLEGGQKSQAGPIHLNSVVAPAQETTKKSACC